MRDLRRYRRDVALGGSLGLFFGAGNVIAAELAPLADDTPAALLAFYGPMFIAWRSAVLQRWEVPC
jgi:hypothetical protein